MGNAVCCNVFVAGGVDPTNENDNLFVLELKPKGLNFHNEKTEEVFQISQVAGSVDALREYLDGGKDVFDGRQNWFYVTKDMEEHLVKPLPPPFNDIDAYVELCWTKADVIFDDAAQLICNLHDKAFTELELQKANVGELTVIRAIKGAEDTGSRKGELIDSILANQKSKGLTVIRVRQKTLEVIS